MSAPPVLETEAFHWVLRLEQGRLSYAERRTLMTWLQQGRQQQRALIHARAFCNYIDELAGLEALAAGRGATQAQPARSLSRRRLLQLGAGAGVLVVAGVAGVVWLGGDPLDEERRYVTRIGGRRQLTLPDASGVLLNTDSDARVSSKGRDLRLLRGEALISASRGTQPFVVHVPGWLLTTVGAIFAVREDTGRVVVAVEEGELTLRHNATGKTYRPLRPYFEAVLEFAGGIAVRAVTGSELNDRLAWRDGHVTFRHVRLADAVAEMNRYLARRIRLADPSVASRIVVGSWPISRPEEFVSSLETGFRLHAVQGEGEILLTRATPAATEHVQP